MAEIPEEYIDKETGLPSAGTIYRHPPTEGAIDKGPPKKTPYNDQVDRLKLMQDYRDFQENTKRLFDDKGPVPQVPEPEEGNEVSSLENGAPPAVELPGSSNFDYRQFAASGPQSLLAMGNAPTPEEKAAAKENASGKASEGSPAADNSQATPTPKSPLGRLAVSPERIQEILSLEWPRGHGMIDAIKSGWEDIKQFMSKGDEESAFRIAASLAGAGAQNALLSPEMKGAIGTFGGRGASGFKKANAENRTFLGLEGASKFEINDASLNWKPNAFNKADKSVYKLGDLVEHKPLFMNYNDAKNIIVRFDGNIPPGDAHFNPNNNVISLNPSGKGTTQGLQSILHEVQHWIQDTELFARGGDSRTGKSAIRKFTQTITKYPTEYAMLALEKAKDSVPLARAMTMAAERNWPKIFQRTAGEETPQTVKADFRRLVDTFKDNPHLVSNENNLHNFVHSTAFKLYQQLGGEVESRLVADKFVNPSAKSDTPHWAQILLNDSNEAFSTMQSTSEKILSPAMQTKDGKIVTGVNHSEATRNLAEQNGISMKEAMALLEDHNGGFVTSTGRYVNRQEALSIASKNDQLRPLSKGKESDIGLLSEDFTQADLIKGQQEAQTLLSEANTPKSNKTPEQQQQAGKINNGVGAFKNNKWDRPEVQDTIKDMISDGKNPQEIASHLRSTFKEFSNTSPESARDMVKQQIKKITEQHISDLKHVNDYMQEQFKASIAAAKKSDTPITPENVAQWLKDAGVEMVNIQEKGYGKTTYIKFKDPTNPGVNSEVRIPKDQHVGNPPRPGLQGYLFDTGSAPTGKNTFTSAMLNASNKTYSQWENLIDALKWRLSRSPDGNWLISPGQEPKTRPAIAAKGPKDEVLSRDPNQLEFDFNALERPLYGPGNHSFFNLKGDDFKNALHEWRMNHSHGNTRVLSEAEVKRILDTAPDFFDMQIKSSKYGPGDT